MKMDSINKLTLNIIIKYLEFPDLCNLRQVNKWFNKRVIIKIKPTKYIVQYEYFPDLESICLSYYTDIKNEDINFLKNLKILDCSYTNITDFSNFINLEELDIYERGDLKNEDIKCLKNLKKLDCRYTNITDFSNFINLAELNIYDRKDLKNEDIKYLKNLKKLECQYTKITDFSNFINLEYLYISSGSVLEDYYFIFPIKLIKLYWCDMDVKITKFSGRIRFDGLNLIIS